MIVPSDTNMSDSDTSDTDNLETESETESYHSNIPTDTSRIVSEATETQPVQSSTCWTGYFPRFPS
jgi:hypothetical protein